MNKIDNDKGTKRDVRGQVEIKLQRKQRRYSGRRTIAIVLMMMIAVLFLSAEIMATNEKGANMIDDTSLPQPKLTKKIDLSYMHGMIGRLAFSPDGRYLAIVYNTQTLIANIIIWDMEHDRELTRIENLPAHANDPDTNLLWGADGKYITFGKGFNEKYPIQFWDPLTGKLIKEIPVSKPCGSARLNRDRSKMLVCMGDQSFRIYDTNTWEFKDYDTNGLGIISISWTSEDKILIAGIWPPSSKGNSLDGRYPETSEAIARLMDLSYKQPSHHIVLSPPVPTGRSLPLKEVGFWPYHSIVDFAGNKIALNYSKIIDGNTLEVLTYASSEDVKNHKIPTEAKAFSPDGRYLYLLGFEGKGKSLILDARTGKPLVWFEGGMNDIAVSPDGRQLATVRSLQYIKIFNLK